MPILTTSAGSIYKPLESDMSKRFPWNTIRGWTVSSLANGNMLIAPDYIHGEPGVLTRLRVADWILHRLCKRASAKG